MEGFSYGESERFLIAVRNIPYGEREVHALNILEFGHVIRIDKRCLPKVLKVFNFEEQRPELEKANRCRWKIFLYEDLRVAPIDGKNIAYWVFFNFASRGEEDVVEARRPEHV